MGLFFGGLLFAHSVNQAGVRHSLVDHLRGTAALAERFAGVFGGGKIGRILGLAHDAGKASCVWQDGLLRAEKLNSAVGLDHKSLAARMLVDAGWHPFALAAHGHHGGLRDPGYVMGRLKALPSETQDAHAEALGVLEDLVPELFGQWPAVADQWMRDPLVRDMAVRLLFSALVDADFLDTAAHFADEPTPRVRQDADFDGLWERFELARVRQLADRPRSAVDGVRSEVYDSSVAAGLASRGVFRLAAPTGSGKTLAAAGFGLRHAAAHGMQRVIVAVPFLTITEQNAAVYRALLDGAGKPTVLEHHSGVDLDGDDPKGRWDRLAAENWDAPFVVTTTVRLFEALFGRRPARMRRVHRLAGAVIVLDEVQALPHRLLTPILDGLRSLVDHFGSTVLLSSATQPDFWHLSPFRQLPARDVISDPKALSAKVKRVRFQWQLDPKPTLKKIADQAAGLGSALVVVNTTKDAAAVFTRWRSEGLAGFHLSTRMCPAHRRRVLDRVRTGLGAPGRSVLVVSTQLVEAGVDLDFPVVFRAAAPADSLLQAAGRANREGRLAHGTVVIFDPADGSQPPAYTTPTQTAARFFGPELADPDDLDALSEYYRELYDRLDVDGKESVGQRIQTARRSLDFPAVSDGPDGQPQYAFRMIEEDGVSIVTPQGAPDAQVEAEIADVLTRLRSEPVPDLRLIRRLQPYITTLYPRAVRSPGVTALLRPVLGDPTSNRGLVEWVGTYDPDTGISIDPNIEEYLC